MGLTCNARRGNPGERLIIIDPLVALPWILGNARANN